MKLISKDDFNKEGARLEETLNAIKNVCAKHRSLRQDHLKKKFLQYYDNLSHKNKIESKKRNEMSIKQDLELLKNSSQKISPSNLIEDDEKKTQNNENKYNIAKRVFLFF